MINGISEVVIAAITDPANSSAAHNTRIHLGPYISPRRPSIGVATAPVSRVAVMAHEALAPVVSSRAGSCGISGMIRVCMSETLIPAAARTAISSPSDADRRAG